MTATPTPPQQPVPTLSWSAFAKWAGAFALLSFVLVSLSDSSGSGADVGGALAWLIAISATAFWYEDFITGFAEITGAKI